MPGKMRDDARKLLAEKYVLFCCEGRCESVIIERLASERRLLVPDARIVRDAEFGVPYTNLRSGRKIEDKYLRGKSYSIGGEDQLVIARVFDSDKDKLSFSSLYRSRVTVLDFLTKPEIEMLVIVREGAYSEWDRARRKNKQLRASEFCSNYLDIGYSKSMEYHEQYWSCADDVVDAIGIYVSMLGKRKGDFLNLSDMLA